MIQITKRFGTWRDDSLYRVLKKSHIFKSQQLEMTSSLCFYESVYKTCQRQLTELNLGERIVHSTFHKICKFENHVTRNDVIMTSLLKQWKNADLRETKQIIYHSKGIDESYPKMYFLLNLSDYVKSVWAFMSNFGIFYNTCPLNMAMSRDPRSKF